MRHTRTLGHWTERKQAREEQLYKSSTGQMRAAPECRPQDDNPSRRVMSCWRLKRARKVPSKRCEARRVRSAMLSHAAGRQQSIVCGGGGAERSSIANVEDILLSGRSDILSSGRNGARRPIQKTRWTAPWRNPCASDISGRTDDAKTPSSRRDFGGRVHAGSHPNQWTRTQRLRGSSHKQRNLKHAVQRCTAPGGGKPMGHCKSKGHSASRRADPHTHMTRLCHIPAAGGECVR